MEDSLQNHEKLAEWAGLECRCETITARIGKDRHGNRYWGKCPRHSNNGNPPDYDKDEVAISLLPVIVNKIGYVALYNYAGGWQVDYGVECAEPSNMDGWRKTIAAAITGAVLKLIEAKQ